MMNRGGPDPGDTRNMIVAVVLIGLIMIGSQVFLWGPRDRELRTQQAQIETQEEVRREDPARPPLVEREQALTTTAAARATIDTAAVDGSIFLEGARFDDLNLRQYRQTVEDDSPEVTLLSPRGSEDGFDAFFGWEDRDAAFAGVGANDVWTAQDGARLTQETPLVLSFATGDGLEVTRTISVDANYMFTITDEVRNASGATRAVRPFGAVRRQGALANYTHNGNVHEGFVGAFGENQRLHTVRYRKAQDHARDRARGRVGEDERIQQEQGQGGWLGITDHYWLAAIVPAQDERISGYFDTNYEDEYTDYRAAYRGAWREIPAGGSATYTQHLFAGAKRVALLRDYQNSLNIPKFEEAIDWGNIMWPLTKPFFNWLLHPLSQFAHNSLGVPAGYAFALGILLTTVVIKLLIFPLVYHSYKEMAKMRAVAPKMKEIQERFAADKQRQQQEMIRLYQTEKVNPVSGCLPMLLTIPVFFALYKVLSVTIEMRHAPFWGWIQDMSARDPTSAFNLFGLLPYDPTVVPLLGPTLFAIGAWPLMYGITQWALMGLSPPPTDPVQAQIFRLLPIVFTFIYALFPAGLVIYWVWSNILTIAQQYFIMRRQGVETQFDQFIAKRFKRAPASAE